MLNFLFVGRESAVSPRGVERELSTHLGMRMDVNIGDSASMKKEQNGGTQGSFNQERGFGADT